MKVTPTRKKFGKYSPGDEFELPDKAARILIKIDRVREVVPTYESKDMKAEDSTSDAKPAPVAKRAYRRRDMQAEQ